MRYGVTICNHGDFAHPGLLRDLGVAAEEAGWDGVFLWDHVARRHQPPMTDPWIALAAIATVTDRVILGPMVTPLPRRRPWKLARETVALDHLSGGRLVLGVGIGVRPEEFDHLGEETDPRARAALLDDGLDLVTGLWRGEPVAHRGPAGDVTAWFRPGPVQQPRIPHLGGRPVAVEAADAAGRPLGRCLPHRSRRPAHPGRRGRHRRLPGRPPGCGLRADGAGDRGPDHAR